MKKQQNFSTPFGVLLLIVVLVGVFIFVSRPKPKEVTLPIEAVKPVIPKEAPIPTAEIIKPKPPAEIVKPKPPAEIVKPKPPVEIVKPKAPVEALKPKVPEKPKPIEKKVVAEVPKPKPKFSIFQIFKPKPKPVPVVPAPVLVVPPKLPAEVPVKGKIAIVLDDWGYNKNNMSIIDEIKYPITAAVLPNLSYSKEMAIQLHKRGYEIILHLPMQPHGPQVQEKNTITTSLDDSSIRNIVNRDLNSLSYAKGINNHMGSLATEDPRVMEVVFMELNKRHLYFLDSYVTPKTVCSQLASKMDVPFAQRDIFLDNQEDPEYIRQQIYKLKDVVKSQGYAIGVGHDRKITLEVLSKVMPELEKEGYKFVPLSDVVKK